MLYSAIKQCSILCCTCMFLKNGQKIIKRECTLYSHHKIQMQSMRNILNN